MYNGYVQWLCRVVMYSGYVEWLCSGYVEWLCTLVMYSGYVEWLCLKTLGPFSTLRTGDVDLRFYITTVQDG